MITLGLRLRDLGSERLSWLDLRVIVSQSPAGSALRRSMGGQDAEWTLSNQLLAAQVDALNMLVWTKTKDAQKNRNRPKPVPRPGVEARAGRMKGAVSASVDRVKHLLALPRVGVDK